MPTKYELQRRQKRLLKTAFPDMKQALLTKPQKLDEEKKIMDVDKNLK